MPDVIYVNLDWPEDNREVMIFYFENHTNTVTGEVVNGYQIVLERDLRDIYSQTFKAELINPHEIVITMPSMSTLMTKDNDSRFAALKHLNINCDKCQQAQMMAAAAVANCEERQVKRLRLVFPDQIFLMNMDSAVDKVLKNRMEPFTTNFGHHGSIVLCNMTWRVARLDSFRKMNSISTQHNATELERLMQGLSMKR